MWIYRERHPTCHSLIQHGGRNSPLNIKKITCLIKTNCPDKKRDYSWSGRIKAPIAEPRWQSDVRRPCCWVTKRWWRAPRGVGDHVAVTLNRHRWCYLLGWRLIVWRRRGRQTISSEVTQHTAPPVLRLHFDVAAAPVWVAGYNSADREVVFVLAGSLVRP